MRYSEQWDDMILDLEELRVERQYAHMHTYTQTHSLQLHGTGRDREGLDNKVTVRTQFNST